MNTYVAGRSRTPCSCSTGCDVPLGLGSILGGTAASALLTQHGVQVGATDSIFGQRLVLLARVCSRDHVFGDWRKSLPSSRSDYGCDSRPPLESIQCMAKVHSQLPVSFPVRGFTLMAFGVRVFRSLQCAWYRLRKRSRRCRPGRRCRTVSPPWWIASVRWKPCTWRAPLLRKDSSRCVGACCWVVEAF